MWYFPTYLCIKCASVCRTSSACRLLNVFFLRDNLLHRICLPSRSPFTSPNGEKRRGAVYSHYHLLFNDFQHYSQFTPIQNLFLSKWAWTLLLCRITNILMIKLSSIKGRNENRSSKNRTLKQQQEIHDKSFLSVHCVNALYSHLYLTAPG